MKPAAPIALGLLVLALVVVYARQGAELRRARERLASLERKAVAGAPAEPPEPVRETKAASDAEAEGVGIGATNRVPTFEEQVGEAVRQMRDNPAFRRLAYAQASSQMDLRYASLYRQLGPEVAGPLAELLRQRSEMGVDIALKLELGDLGPEERRRVQREAAEDGLRREERIRELLGPEHYAIFQEYEETVGERNQVATFKDKLNSAGFGLAPSQEDALIRIMRDERLRPLTEEEDPELYVLSTSLPEERGLKQQQIELLRQQQLNRRYLEQAKTILTPEQLVVYEEYLNQWQDLRTKYVEYMPSPEVEAHDRATVELARSDAVSTGPVTVGAAGSEPQQWGDDPNGSSSIVYRTGGNLLGVEFSPGSGWGTGLTFQPQHTAMNEDESADASGVTRLVARLKAPAGATLRFGLLESGADWSGAATFPGAKGADGEAFRHEGVTTLDGWQVYTIPLSELKLNGGYGNQRGNRRIDTQAIKGIEILAPGGQAAFGMEIDYVRIE